MSRSRYDKVAIALHWVVAVVVIAQLAFGWFLTDVPRGSPERGSLVNLHKSIGLAIWLLVAIRLGWRWTHAPPALPGPAWQRRAARTTHFILYGALFTMPVAGYLASNFSKHGILLFGAVRLRPWGRDDPSLYALFNGFHVSAAWVLTAFLALHLGAALYHAWKRDGVLDRMWPRARATRRVFKKRGTNLQDRGRLQS
jgi:cytochrome b561